MVQSVQGMIYRVLYFTIQQNLINVSLKMYVLKKTMFTNQLIILEDTYICTMWIHGVHLVWKGEVTTHDFGCAIMVKIVNSFVDKFLHVSACFIVLVL